MAAACLGLLASAAPAQAAPEAVPGELIVRFEPGVSAAQRADVRADADVSFERTSRLSGVQLVEVESGQSVGGADRELEADPRVRYAEPNTVVRPASTPNDPFFSSLWGLHNTGQPVNGTSGLADKDIDAPEAWDITRGDSSVVVAVADTGIAYDHPDLASRMWQNDAEANGTAGVDDDANGYVDDARGWDTIDGDSDPRDLEDHGTHVAGTIGAAGDDAVGVTGVAQDVRLMPVRVLRPGGGNSLSVAEGFDYAADMGADVVNASLSGDGSSQLVRDAVAAHPQTLYVVAAGNDGADVDAVGGTNTVFPCNVPEDNLVCVAATNQSDQRAGFSNYGATSVDVGAPGTNIRSSLPASAELAGTADGFESETEFPARWTAGGAWARTDLIKAAGQWSASDSPSGDYTANADSSLQSKGPYDLSGKQGCFAHFKMRLRTETDYDFLRVESSADGATWTEQDRWSGDAGTGFRSYSAYLDNDGGPAYVRFRFTSDSEVNADGVHIDDVRVRCSSSSYSSADYGYFGGTSMASPHVAGAAALAKALRPGASVAQLRADLLQGGDPVAALSGTTTSGRRLNARGSLQHGGPLAVTGAPSATGTGGATLTGRVNPVGAETSYRFEYGLDQGYGSQTTPRSAGAGPTAQPVSEDVSGLQPGTTYHYRLVASRDGVDRPGDDMTFTTTTGPAAPAQPTGVVATPGPRRVRVDWEDVSGATGYQVFSRAAGDAGYPTTPEASPSASEHVSSPLEPEAERCFKVRAVNHGPGPFSDEVCATPEGTPPAAVSNLSATAGVGSVTLSWPAAEGAQSYLVHRRSSTGTYPAMPRASVTGSAYSDSGLTAGATYCYVVQGSNKWGLGPFSPERCATAKSAATSPPAPVPPAPAPQPEQVVLVDLSRVPRTLAASRRGVFTFSFRATAGLSGPSSFATTRRVRLTARSRPRIAKLGSKGFRADGRGVARVKLRLSRRSRALLHRSRRLRVKATVSASGRKRTRTFILKAPRGR